MYAHELEKLLRSAIANWKSEKMKLTSTAMKANW